MEEVLGHFIDGKFISPKENKKHPIYNPALGEPIKQVLFASSIEANAAIQAAEAAFPSWSATPALKRARILFKFKDLIEQHRKTLATLLTTEHGKVIEDAEGEVMRGLELVEYLCGIPALLKGDFSHNVGTGVDCYTFRQPLGVCVGITPFNFPVMIGCWMLVSAIACGNTFILKPSEKTPSAPLFLAKLMQEAGLPAGVLNVLNGGQSLASELITHPSVQAVECVGSTPVAEHIYQTALANGKRAHTFGGAKNHCVVMPDADLDEAATTLVGAAFGAAGERCMAISVALVVGESTTKCILEKIKTKSSSLKIGNGLTPGLEMGPLVTSEHKERVLAYIDIGVEEGAKLIVDGRNYQHIEYPQGFFIGPSVFTEVEASMRIYQEEIFGPVLIVMTVDSLEAAIKLINENAYGNGTSILTQNGYAAQTFSNSVQVGMVGVNIAIPVPVAYHAFGGWKRSVFGDLHMHGSESILFYTKSKSVTMRWPKSKELNSSFHMPVN